MPIGDGLVRVRNAEERRLVERFRVELDTEREAWLVAGEATRNDQRGQPRHVAEKRVARAERTEDKPVKQVAIIAVLLILLLIGGGLTMQLISSGDQGIMPVLQQTSNPEASPSELVPWKAEQLFLAVGFILFNLIGMAVTLAIIVWLIDRGIRKGRAEAGITTTTSNAPANRAGATDEA